MTAGQYLTLLMNAAVPSPLSRLRGLVPAVINPKLERDPTALAVVLPGTHEIFAQPVL